MALDEQVKNRMQAAVEAVRAGMPGYRSRYGQRQMMAEIAKTLAGEYGERRFIAVEGPTGTGKSLGYFLGAIPVAQALEKKLVLATATVALQEQLIHKDLPEFAEAANLEFSLGLAKGRQRYVCNRNLDIAAEHFAQGELSFAAASDDSAGLSGPLWARPPTSADRETVQGMNEALKSGHWSGDLDEWPQAPDEALRSVVTTSRHGCLNRQCGYFQQCAFFSARRELMDRDVIVANHDLVLSDLALGGGAILPEPENCIYVFDEGHHLAEKARAHFSAHATLKGASQWLDAVPELIANFRQQIPENQSVLKCSRQAETSVPALMKALQNAYEALAGPFESQAETVSAGDVETEPERRWLLLDGAVPQALREPGEAIARHAEALARTLDLLKEVLNEALKSGRLGQALAQPLAQQLGFYHNRLETLQQAWSWITDPSDTARADAPPRARWFTERSARSGHDFRVSVSPVSMGETMEAYLWSRAYGAVITSATLTSLGSFERLRTETGLKADDGTQYLQLDSPFDYPRLGTFRVPALSHEPGDFEGHTREVAHYVTQALGQSRGLVVIFTSARQMRAVANELPDEARGHVLMQRELAKATLLARHREAIDSGASSVIFGLDSFAEGLDLPGELCTHVIIAKLPFSVPSSPIERVHAHWLEQHGRNPFMEVAVPDASLKLIQTCGRLIRKEDDRGTVSLLDKRILTRRYGRLLRAHLPAFRQVLE